MFTIHAVLSSLFGCWVPFPSLSDVHMTFFLKKKKKVTKFWHEHFNDMVNINFTVLFNACGD